jgi:hypothetical protein
LLKRVIELLEDPPNCDFRPNRCLTQTNFGCIDYRFDALDVRQVTLTKAFAGSHGAGN